MSRFIDTSAAVEVDLGACQCPNTPHPDGDRALVRSFLSGVDMLAIGAAADDPHLQMVRLLNRGIKAWNLTDEKGKPVPINPQTVSELDSETASQLAAEIDRQFDQNTVPNASSGRSPGGSPGKNSRSPKTPRTRKPTAPSSSSTPAGLNGQ